MTTKKGKTPRAKAVRSIEVEGKLGWEYDDGSIRYANGQLMKKPPYEALQAASITTSEQGYAMQKRRHDLMLEQFAAGFVAGAPVKDKTPAGAWAAVGKKVAELFFSATSARGVESILPHIARFGDFASQNDKAEPALADPEIRGILMRIAEVARRVPAEVVEGEVTTQPKLGGGES